MSIRVPEGDRIPRHVCNSCNTIHYQNPKIVAGCILEWENRILLCRRAIEPRYGLWTFPAGFMENSETAVQAAIRECSEEANADVVNAQLFALYNLPHISQVYIMFRGRLKAGRASPGAESLEIALFAEQDIPWTQLAFPVVYEGLELYFRDREQGNYSMHMGDIFRSPDRKIQINRY